VENYQTEFQADINAAQRDQDLESAEVKALSEQEIFERLRHRLL
jgi:hypothetical protein